MGIDDWKNFFSKEPKKAEPMKPIRLESGEMPSFRYTEKDKKEMRAGGLSDKEIADKEERVNTNLVAEALVRKMQEEKKAA
jgi:hypothetical protein